MELLERLGKLKLFSDIKNSKRRPTFRLAVGHLKPLRYCERQAFLHVDYLKHAGDFSSYIKNN
jgi:hypothetical protein